MGAGEGWRCWRLEDRLRAGEGLRRLARTRLEDRPRFASCGEDPIAGGVGAAWDLRVDRERLR